MSIANSSRGARQLGWARCLASAGRVTLPGGTTFSHTPPRDEMAQIVSGVRHFLQYVTCLAVSRETSVLEGQLLQLTTPYKGSVKLSRGEGLSRVPETI